MKTYDEIDFKYELNRATSVAFWGGWGIGVILGVALSSLTLIGAFWLTQVLING